MNHQLKLIYTYAIAFIISSCGSGSSNLPKMKLIPVKTGEDYQYVDREGKIIINPQFSQATLFRDGLALVRSSGEEKKWGYISENGKYAITANYKSATVFSEGLAWVVADNGAPTAINKDGEIQITLTQAERVSVFKEGLAAFSISDSSGVKWGFTDKEGTIKINPQFTEVGNFSEGKCAVRNIDGKWGYIDLEGKIVINNQFQLAKEFQGGKAVVNTAGKAGLIDENGKYVINPQFSDMLSDGDIYLIKQWRKWGWCDGDGKIIINPQFNEAFPFSGEELAAVKSGRNWGYIDTNGKIVINPQFDSALPFNGNLAIVENINSIGFINNKGKYIANPQFNIVSRDVVLSLLNIHSEFESVESDYFDIAAITGRINLKSPEGLSLDSKISEVMDNLKINKNRFSEYSTEHRVIKSQKITKDASLSFYIISNPYTSIIDGWYERKVFNPAAKVYGYMYVIELSRKGKGKAEQVIDAIENSLKDYNQDTGPDKSVKVYKNTDQSITLRESRGSVIVFINKVVSKLD
jgi:hypothetical protein